MMIFTNFFPTHLSGIESFYIFVGTSSIIAGYIGLGYQWQIRRFLTYSSCANMGFIVLAIACLELDSALFYSVVYFLTSMTIFGVLLVLSYLNGREILFINQLRGLFNQNQTLAIVLSLALFSLAGVPILSGFVAKLIVLQAYLNNGWIWVSIIAVISSVVSAAYYLYIVKISLFDLSASKIKIKVPTVSSYILA
jgi:NADH-quinone oxidoreductase subunit N